MSSLEPRRGSRPSRQQREQCAYRLVVAGGVAGTSAAVSFVLAIIGVMSFGLPLIALVVAVVCLFLFRRVVGPPR